MMQLPVPVVVIEKDVFEFLIEVRDRIYNTNAWIFYPDILTFDTITPVLLGRLQSFFYSDMC